MDWLVFIDTNILLDFYRTEGKKQQGLAVLKHLEDNYEQFITTTQVEMEFKKNRQRVIEEAFQPFAKLASQTKKALPAFLEETQAAQSLAKAEIEVQKHIKRLRKQATRIIETPTVHDEVYKAVQRLFSTDTPHNLNRQKEERFKIRDLARKRFELGYPPRKNSDTSYGDAINWEWIVHCAKTSKRNVVIVSRDSDYGQLVGKQRFLNTWLRQEFFAQTSRKHKIQLTELLTNGLKTAGITVSQEEQEQESEFIERQRRPGEASSLSVSEALSILENLSLERTRLEDSIRAIKNRDDEI